MQAYQRIFGAGPRGLVIGLLMLLAAWWLEPQAGLPVIHGHDGLGAWALGISTVVTLVGLVWSLKSLPVDQRGHTLVDTGAYRFVRHPLYASVLLGFDWGLVLYLDNWIYVVWAALQLPFWRLNVVGEERLMRAQFGADYDAYCHRTGRFVPKWSAVKGFWGIG